MVLVNRIVEILGLFHLGLLGQRLLVLKLLNRRRIRRMFVHIDHPWRLGVVRLQRLLEKALIRFGIALGTPPKVQGLTTGIHSSIEILPRAVAFDVRLVHPLRAVSGMQMRMATLIQLGTVL